MIANFDKSLQLVLRHEGGFVNHPDDPGGMTNKGITANVLAAHLGRDVTAADVRNISDQTVATIYRRNYWDAARCNLLPDGLDYAVFDFAVNSGVSRAVRMLQTVLGVKADGVIGDITANAVRSTDTMDVIEELCTRRMAFLKGLRTWRTFGKGWTRRVMGQRDGAQGIEDDGVIDRAQAMLMGAATTLPRVVDDGANAKAREDDVAAATTVKEAVRDPAVITTVGSIATAAITSGNGDGPLAYGVSAVLVIVAIAGVFLVLRSKR